MRRTGSPHVVRGITVLVDPAEGDHLLLGKVALQRREDAAGMQRERPHPRVLAERVELDGEQRIGGFRPSVRLPLVIAVLELDVVPADGRVAVTGRGYGDDASSFPGESGPQPVDEREVAEVVGRELRLPPGADARFGTGHDCGAVDHDVGGSVSGQETLRESADAVEIPEVELVDLDAVDGRDRRLRGRGPTGWHDHVSTGAGQRARRLAAETGVPAGDERQLAGEVDSAKALLRGALGPEAGPDLVLWRAHKPKGYELECALGQARGPPTDRPGRDARR